MAQQPAGVAGDVRAGGRLGAEREYLSLGADKMTAPSRILGFFRGFRQRVRFSLRTLVILHVLAGLGLGIWLIGKPYYRALELFQRWDRDKVEGALFDRKGWYGPFGEKEAQAQHDLDALMSNESMAVWVASSYLSHQDARMRRLAIQVLQRLADPDLIPYDRLIPLLGDPWPTPRYVMICFQSGGARSNCALPRLRELEGNADYYPHELLLRKLRVSVENPLSESPEPDDTLDKVRQARVAAELSREPEIRSLARSTINSILESQQARKHE
ncbi:MAG: hypothetical protein M5U26_28865 [Planctomycetota bacterium]|nr:hypothetical protein [Planctomycetota bacterium]